MKIADIADKGDNLETLKELRHKLAETIDESKSGRDISSLARQLQIVMIQIEKLEEERKESEDVTVLDIVRARHAQQVRDARGRGAFNLYDDDEDE